MKRTTISASGPVRTGHGHKHVYAALTIIISCTVAESCIYDTPHGDEFYRTLWETSEAPLGPYGVSALTLEFLCNEGISIKTTGTGNSRTIYGTYECTGTTATFRNLTLYLPLSEGNRTADEGTIGEGTVSTGTNGGRTTAGDYTLTFIEAHRNGDTLFLQWRVDGIPYPFTTALHRLSEYE